LPRASTGTTTATLVASRMLESPAAELSGCRDFLRFDFCGSN
jgi:hypothetical protein